MPEINRPLVGIVICNYNYGRFVAQAISSALNQSYPSVEVIVVDDGSSDNSREVIDGFGDRIIRVYKQNGGQASAMNAGFAKTRGDLVIFLDADDYLEPDIVADVILQWDGKATKIHYRLAIVDNAGTVIGHDPSTKIELPSGNIQSSVLARAHYHTPPASGNVYSRAFLQTVMPVPEETFRLCADMYLYILAPLYGDVLALARPGANYRVHGNNCTLKRRRFSTVKELKTTLRYSDCCLALIDDFVQSKGLKRIYSPKYYLHPNFNRLLLLRVEQKLDHATTFRLLGYIFYSIFTDATEGIKSRLAMIGKTMIVAFTPLSFVWHFYPNTRPPEKPAHCESAGVS